MFRNLDADQPLEGRADRALQCIELRIDLAGIVRDPNICHHGSFVWETMCMSTMQVSSKGMGLYCSRLTRCDGRQGVWSLYCVQINSD